MRLILKSVFKIVSFANKAVERSMCNRLRMFFHLMRGQTLGIHVLRSTFFTLSHAVYFHEVLVPFFPATEHKIAVDDPTFEKLPVSRPGQVVEEGELVVVLVPAA